MLQSNFIAKLFIYIIANNDRRLYTVVMPRLITEDCCTLEQGHLFKVKGHMCTFHYSSYTSHFKNRPHYCLCML